MLLAYAASLPRVCAQMCTAVCYFAVSYGGNITAAPFWVSNNQTGTTLSGCTHDELGLRNAAPDWQTIPAGQGMFEVRLSIA